MTRLIPAALALRRRSTCSIPYTARVPGHVGGAGMATADRGLPGASDKALSPGNYRAHDDRRIQRHGGEMGALFRILHAGTHKKDARENGPLDCSSSRRRHYRHRSAYRERCRDASVRRARLGIWRGKGNRPHSHSRTINDDRTAYLQFAGASRSGGWPWFASRRQSRISH
jgi:hypothetical protein